MTESGQWSNFLSELGDWWRTVTSLHTLWWVTVWRRKAWKKGRSMGWPYDVVIQRGTCRFLLKITAGPDQNSSSISVVLFLLDASLMEEGGMAGWGCIVLFFIPLSLSKKEGERIWKREQLESFESSLQTTNSCLIYCIGILQLILRSESLLQKVGRPIQKWASACLARRYTRSSKNCAVLHD